MFDIAQAEVATRLMAARQFLALVQPIETTKPLEAATCKGLLFIELYGAYEYCVRAVVQAALSALRVDSVGANEVRRELLALILDPRFTAAAKAGRRRLWEERLALIAALESKARLASLDDTLFPADGSHFREDQLATIWRVFGIDQPIVPESRHRGRIEELVENRNAIAHGRKTAEQVGRRYSAAELDRTIGDIDAITAHIVETMRMQHSSGGLRR